MKKIGPMLAAKTLTQDKLVEGCKAAGLEKLPDLAQRPDLIPVVEAYLGV